MILYFYFPSIYHDQRVSEGIQICEYSRIINVNTDGRSRQ